MSGSDDTSDSGSGAKSRDGRARRRRRSRRGHPQLDLGALLREPLHILVDGKRANMDPLEAAVRRQVQEALTRKSMPAIKAVIDLAIEHGLVAPRPPRPCGGVLHVPTAIGMDVFRAYFVNQSISLAALLDIVNVYYEQSHE